jgi:hypothetical protein
MDFATKPSLEEGVCQLIKDPETVHALVENSNNSNTKIFLSVNYPESSLDNELASLYTDPECNNLFQELSKQTKKGVNNIYSFDIPSSTKLYLKSNLTNEFFFYYKYTTEAEIEKIDCLKKSLKVLTIKCLENKENKLKIEFENPYTKEIKFNTKYSIYVSEKKYRIFKDEKLESTKIVEGTQDKYETQVQIDSSKKEQYVYIVAEPKDASVSLRPRVIYKVERIPEADNKLDNIINGILIVLIIITLIYKFYKKRKLRLQKAQANAAGNSTLI